MFKALISRLPENAGGKLAKDLIREHPGLRLFEAAALHGSVDGLVASYLGSKLKRSSRTFMFAAIDVAAELHDRGMLVTRKSSSKFAGIRKEVFDRKHIVLHRYVWGQELCERVVSQCWGRIGKERLGWIKSDDRSKTNEFGVDITFLAMFVDCEKPLYERVESVPGQLDGVVLQAIEAC